MKSKNILIISIISIILIGLIGAGIYFAISEPTTQAIVGFTPIYCNDYSFTCCVEYISTTQSFTIGVVNALTCPSTATKCEITGTLRTGISPQKFVIGSGVCDDYTWWGGWSCENERESTASFITLQPGERLWMIPNGEVNVQHKTYREKLIFTGRSGSTIGVPVEGADGCKFNPSATYKDGRLVSYEITGTSYVVSEGQCIQTFIPGDRHICGNIEEQCSTDQDCGGHTYGNQECIGRNLQTYGCTKFGLPYYLETYGSAVAYKPFEGDNDGNEGALSRCEITSSRTVQCCGDNDCGSNAFCDKSTWTCEETAQCSQNSDCGVSEQCDRVTKEIKKPICSSGSCDFEILQDVECCISEDCPTDFFCDTDKICKESIVSKINCPFECCEGEELYFERPCSGDDFCVDNVCQEEKPEECKWWNIWCKLNLFLEKFKLSFAIVLGFIGGLLGGLFANSFTKKQKQKTRLITILIVSGVSAVIFGVLAYFFLLWVLLGLIILAIIKFIIPGI